MALSKCIHNLAKQAQYSSLAHGGCAMMMSEVSISPDLYQLRLQVPGFSAQNLRVEVLNYDILVYSHGHALVDGADSHRGPLFVHTHLMPKDVDRSNISAHIRSNMLCVDLPRVETPSTTYHRVIAVEK